MAQAPSDAEGSQGNKQFSTEDALQFLTRMWNPFGVPMPGFPATGVTAPSPAGGGMGVGLPSPASMFASLDPAEIERKIGELRIIENWLKMSLDFMQMSIKTMELQKASLEALRAPAVAAAAAEEERRTSSARGKKPSRK